MKSIIVIVVGVLAFGAGTWWSMSRQDDGAPAGATSKAENLSGYVLDQPRALPEMNLVDDGGHLFTTSEFEGQWSLIYFGFTFCPDVCPSALAEMAEVKRLLDAEGLDFDLRYYLVSVDPDRDTPDRMAEYVNYFDPSFIGLSGEKHVLDQFTRAAGAVYKVPENPVDDNYLVSHSSTFTLINPDAAIHALFTSPLVAANVAADLDEILN